MGISVGTDNVSKISVGDRVSKTGYEHDSYIYGKSSSRIKFTYTGAEQSFTIPQSGTYKLEVRGAAGGTDNRGNLGGRGGYACGSIFLSAGTVLKIYVGEQGKPNPGGLTATAFNGGGRGARSDYRSSNRGNGGGGGASDIRIGGNTLYHRLVVGGGGGGASPNQGGSNWSTMCGGGEEGNSPRSGAQGTQTTGSSFGNGFSSNCNNEGNRYSCNGGGGGRYGGGVGCSTGSSDSWSDSFYAGGGSGFVWTGQTTVPSGYLVPEDYILSDTQNIKGNTEMPNSNGTGTMVGNTGNGCVVISCPFFIPPEQKITQAGVYHNPDLGLISMSADGEHWLTISDRNAEAWSSDLDDPNSIGGYYQFGNIHGFGVLPEPPEPPEPGYSREPGENTICFFPFLTDALDTQGNRTLTLSGCSVTDGALTITGNTQYAQLSSAISNSEITFNMWYRPSAFNGSGSGDWNTILAKSGGTYHHLLISGGNSAEGTVGKIGVWNNGWIGSSKVLTIGQWYNIVLVMNGTNYKLYVNKELVLDTTAFDNSAQPVGFVANYNTSGNQGPHGKLSRMIIESGSWSQDDINNYYEWSSQYYS